MLLKNGFVGWNFVCVELVMLVVVIGFLLSWCKVVGCLLIVVVKGKEELKGLDWKFKEGVGGIVRFLGGGWCFDDLFFVVDFGIYG